FPSRGHPRGVVQCHARWQSIEDDRDRSGDRRFRVVVQRELRREVAVMRVESLQGRAADHNFLSQVDRGSELTEETVHFIVRAGGEVERVGVARRYSVSKLDGPQTVDGDGPALFVAQRAGKVSVRAIGVDAAIAEIADENVSAELAEVRGRLNDAPGSVERTTT